jgi:hypothetical protein
MGKKENISILLKREVLYKQYHIIILISIHRWISIYVYRILIEGALHVLSVTASRESPPDCSAPISKVQIACIVWTGAIAKFVKI